MKVIVRPRHREVLKKMVGNRGMSRSEAMRQVGYKENYALNGTISGTDSWQELIKTFLPDELLAKRHKELLNKREVIKEFNDVTGLYDKKVIDQPETQAVSKGLEMAYRLKSKFPAEKHINYNIPIPLLGGDSTKYENASDGEIAKSD